MTKSLGEDWFAVGEVYFRFIDLFQMPWGHGFTFTRFKLAAGNSSGHIAMLLDGQAGCKPVIQIYSAAGKLVSQQLWKDSPPLTLGWSAAEELLVVQKSGFISVLDLVGNFQRRFSMGPEAEEREIVDCRFFSIHGHTGVAVLTGGNHIYLTSNIESHRVRRFTELAGPSHLIHLWEIITVPLDVGSLRGAQAANHYRGPWLLASTKKTLFRADFGLAEQVDLPILNQLSFKKIHLLSVSPNMKFVALYLDNGTLLVTNLNMSEIHSQLDLTQQVSAMLPSSAGLSPDASDIDRPPSPTQLQHPKAMLWSTNAAVVLQWPHLITVVGAQSDVYESFCPEDVWMTQEVDSVRLLTPTTHRLLQRVPPALEALGRIGASSPATWLLSASEHLQSGSGRTNDYLLPIRSASQMVEAIQHCIEAAGHAVRETQLQRSLLHAAHMGHVFLSAMFTEAEDRPTVGELTKLGDRAARVCRSLRLLNNLAAPWIGLAITWSQFQQLGPKRLLERLLARQHYPMALELVRDWPELQRTVAPASPDQSSAEQRLNGLTQILAHWACHSPVAGSEDVHMIGERLKRIVDRIRATREEITQSDTTSALHHTASHRTAIAVDFAEVANRALVVQREKVAEQVLEYEARAWYQVPLLIKLGRYNPALVRAVETGDPELITVVVAALQDQARLPPADLAMVLRRHPIAMAIYQETWLSGSVGGDKDAIGTGSQSEAATAMQTAIQSFDHDDRGSEAKRAVLQAYKETNLQQRLSALHRAEETYNLAKNEFMAQECNAAARLLTFQSKLEKQDTRAPVFDLFIPTEEDFSPTRSTPLIVPVPEESTASDKIWLGQSINLTLARLLAIPQGERYANQLRREFRVSEKRYAHLRLIGLALQNDCWSEVDKMAKSKKPPVGIETLIKVCIDGNHFQEAMNLIPRLPSERRVRFWVLCGQIEQAIEAAVREKSDVDLCFILERVGKGNRTIHDRIHAMRLRIQ